MDAGFVRVDAGLRALRTELSARIDSQGAELGARIDALQRTMLQVGGGTIAAVLAAALSVIATQG